MRKDKLLMPTGQHLHCAILCDYLFSSKDLGSSNCPLSRLCGSVMVQILADMQEPGKAAVHVAQRSAQNKAVENFCCPRQEHPGLNPVLRAVPGPTDTAAAQAKQRILERLETVESADGAGNGQVA